ncbi:MAG: antitermination protein NusG [Acidimicrobiia bacterium]
MSLAVVLFKQTGMAFAFRWLHIIAGVAWIGLLYYFNFVQVPAFAEYKEASARLESIDKLARRALWWFRWAALATVVLGILIMGATKDYFDNDAHVISILTGALMGVIMFVNVWGIIWRNQKVVLANAVQVMGGGQPLPNLATAQRAAAMASRQNVLFSVAMIWFMTFTSHLSDAYDVSSGGKVATYWIITLVIVALLELNALGIIGGTGTGGLNWPYESVRNVLISAFGLWFVFWIMWEILFKV